MSMKIKYMYGHNHCELIEFSLCYKTLIKNDFMMVLVEDFDCDYISNSNDI